MSRDAITNHQESFITVVIRIMDHYHLWLQCLGGTHMMHHESLSLTSLPFLATPRSLLMDQPQSAGAHAALRPDWSKILDAAKGAVNTGLGRATSQITQAGSGHVPPGPPSEMHWFQGGGRYQIQLGGFHAFFPAETAVD